MFDLQVGTQSLRQLLLELNYFSYGELYRCRHYTRFWRRLEHWTEVTRSTTWVLSPGALNTGWGGRALTARGRCFWGGGGSMNTYRYDPNERYGDSGGVGA